MSSAFDPGLHFWIGLRPSPELTEADRRLLSELRPAGIVLFRENFEGGVDYAGWSKRLEVLSADVRRAIGRERILVGIDHEGGRVVRTPPPITAFPAARAWGGSAGAVGAAMAVELASLGCNVDFAPVVDVDSSPDNPVIGDRAFADAPGAVAAAGRAFLRGLQANGVLGCLKHFPGHGDTRSDSHLELPVVDADVATLRARELAPFAALAGEAPLVMTAHVSFPALDPERPATFSPTLLQGVLRGEMGFPGVVVSDDLGMRAVSDRLDDPGTGAELLAAGVDSILLCAHLADTDRALDLAEGMRRAEAAGGLDRSALARSAARLNDLLARAPQHRPHRLPDDVFARHAALLL